LIVRYKWGMVQVLHSLVIRWTSIIKNYFFSALDPMADNLWYEFRLQNHGLQKSVIPVLEKWNAADEGEFSRWMESDDTLPYAKTRLQQCYGDLMPLHVQERSERDSESCYHRWFPRPH
jgi:hypothetical protein